MSEVQVHSLFHVTVGPHKAKQKIGCVMMTSLKMWCLLSLCVLLSIAPTLSEVLQSMTQCKGFLLGEKSPEVPDILEKGEIKHKHRYRAICQTYHGVRKFVTLYDTKNKIPVLSAQAYLLTGAQPGTEKLNNRVIIPSVLWSAFCCYNQTNRKWLASAFWANNVEDKSPDKPPHLPDIWENAKILCKNHHQYKALCQTCGKMKCVVMTSLKTCCLLSLSVVLPVNR
ncbi:hypothetical protein Q8A73_012750 [Channa argus]|nr:hypothetical protein Q8A73_012750 [Channa argus]